MNHALLFHDGILYSRSITPVSQWHYTTDRTHDITTVQVQPVVVSWKQHSSRGQSLVPTSRTQINGELWQLAGRAVEHARSSWLDDPRPSIHLQRKFVRVSRNACQSTCRCTCSVAHQHNTTRHAHDQQSQYSEPEQYQ